MKQKKRILTIGITYCIFCLFFTAMCGEALAQSSFIKTTAESSHLKKLQTAVEANPGNIKAHQAFISSLAAKDSLLKAQYEIWLKRFPKSPTVAFAIGKALAKREDSKARDYLLKAVAIKPDLAEAWNMLAIDALRWGDQGLSQKYFKKAARADPKSSEYAFQYAFSYKNTDQMKYDSLSLDVVRRFPDSEMAAQSLYWLAAVSTDLNFKLAYYKQLFKLYSTHPSDWGRSGMSAYFNLLINTDPIKAFEFALSMLLEDKKNILEFRHKFKIARTFIDARNLLKLNKPEDAMKILATVDLNNRWSNSFIDAEETLLLFKAEAADAANQTQAAYDSVALYYSKKPSDRLRPEVIAFASKLGMDESQVNAYIWKLRNTRAEQATDFSLERYMVPGKASLSDYRGRVVLLTYWFPGCGPCRREFPHLESVIQKYSDKGVAYLGINIYTRQDDYVVPFMKSSGYSFTPLREEPRDKGNLQERGAPTNYLIDQKGRVVFSDFRIDENNERMLELMISELLEINKEN